MQGKSASFTKPYLKISLVYQALPDNHPKKKKKMAGKGKDRLLSLLKGDGDNVLEDVKTYVKK